MYKLYWVEVENFFWLKNVTWALKIYNPIVKANIHVLNQSNWNQRWIISQHFGFAERKQIFNLT